MKRAMQAVQHSFLGKMEKRFATFLQKTSPFGRMHIELIRHSLAVSKRICGYIKPSKKVTYDSRGCTRIFRKVIYTIQLAFLAFTLMLPNF